MDVDAIRADQESIAAAIDAIVGLRLAVMDVLESWRNTFLDGTGTFAAVVKQRRAALDAALAAFKEAIAGIKGLCSCWSTVQNGRLIFKQTPSLFHLTFLVQSAYPACTSR